MLHFGTEGFCIGQPTGEPTTPGRAYGTESLPRDPPGRSALPPPDQQWSVPPYECGHAPARSVGSVASATIDGWAAMSCRALRSRLLPGSWRGHGEAPEGCGKEMRSNSWPA